MFSNIDCSYHVIVMQYSYYTGGSLELHCRTLVETV